MSEPLQLNRRDLRNVLNDEDLDDFNIHNLRDLDTSSRLSLGKELDLQSTTSTSSTVIHNQNVAHEEAFEHDRIELNTLEDDPGLRNMLLQNKEGEEQGDGEDEDEEDTFHEDTIEDLIMVDDGFPSPPSSPPRELDPAKLYALFDFNGPDPSHLELNKNDSVILLNDSDSYWWLVKRVEDQEVGFAPAEILETYQERLARLNCWKNEIVERGDSDDLSQEQLKLFHTKYEDPNSSSILQHTESLISIERKGSLKKNGSGSLIKKMVSFANIDNVNDETAIPVNLEPITKKRISDTNLFVKHLDDYDERDNASLEDVIVTPQHLSTAGSDDVKLVLPKSRRAAAAVSDNDTSNVIDSRSGKMGKSSDSMRLLDDLLSTFDGMENNKSEEVVDDQHVGLHPTVKDIFDPLFNQVRELDKLLREMEVTDTQV